MKKTFKMEQIFNKFSLGIFFVLVLGFILIPSHNANAIMIAVMELNGGGGNGGTGGSTGGGTPAPVYGSISLTVSPDKSVPYTGGSNMILSSTASVAVCSNSAINLRVTGNISGPESKSVGTILDQTTIGGQVLVSSKNITLPTTPGTYTFNFTATRYDQSGTALQTGGTTILTNVSNFYVETNNTQEGSYLVSTNYRGRIINVTTSGGVSVPLSDLSGAGIIGNDGFSYNVISIGEDPIKTYTTSFNFVVAASPTLSFTVTDQKNNTTTTLEVDPITRKTIQPVISGNNSVRIHWVANNFTDNTKVTCTTPEGPQSKGTVDAYYPSSGSLTNLTAETLFSFTCSDNP